jgi:acylphosphatase
MSREARVADEVLPPDSWPPGDDGDDLDLAGLNLGENLDEGSVTGIDGDSGQGPDVKGDEPVRLTAWVRGRVQGVGFRWWVRSRALALGLVGSAENLTDGRVKVIAEGAKDACAELLELLGGADTPGHVAHVTHRWDEPRGGLVGFVER